MGIDLARIKGMLDKLANQGSKSLWKPQEGKAKVRIVPLKEDPSYPFVTLYFHYLGNKTYLSPMSFGENDPIFEYANFLRSGGGLDKESWNETKKFIPQLRTYVPVIVRGQEDAGIRFWGFGKQTAEKIAKIMADEEYGDITDVREGRDITVEYTPAAKSPTGFAVTDILVSPNKTPLTTDKALLSKYLNEQPDVKTLWTRLSYDDLKKVLADYLSLKTSTPGDLISGGESFTQSESVEVEQPVRVPSRKVQEVSADFDEMFKDS